MNDTEIAPSTPEPAPSRRAGHRWQNDIVFFGIAAIVVVIDQITKGIVRNNLALYEQWPDESIFGFIRIIYVTNSGAAFGILQGETVFLIITSLFGLAAILLYYLYPPMDHGFIRIALGMQLGGAIGNLLDRLRFGEVTDFIDVGGFPTFNVADACISISIVAVLLFFIREESEDRAKQNRTDAGPPTAAHED